MYDFKVEGYKDECDSNEEGVGEENEDVRLNRKQSMELEPKSWLVARSVYDQIYISQNS